MKVPGLGRLQRAWSRMQDRLAGKAVILLYHRVADLDTDPWGLAVSPANFAEQLDILRQRGCVISISEMAAILRSGARELAGKVAITFDDGYADNLFAAKPLIEERQLPATIYMTSGSVGRTREFWWDELERIFLQPGELPAQLELQIEGRQYEWTLDLPRYDAVQFAGQRAWRVETDKPPGERQQLYRALYDLIQGLPRSSREAAMDALTTWSARPADVRPSHRALSPEETRKLADSEWIEVGAHTVRHQALSTQTTAVQEEEIRASKEQLEAMTERAVRSFSYPYGLHTDETVGIVQRAGFDSACACMDTAVRRSSAPFRMPRLVVGDWPGQTFSARLDEWLAL